MDRLLISINEVADWLGVSRQTVNRLVARGEIPVVRVGSRVLVRPRDVEEFVDRQAGVLVD